MQVRRSRLRSGAHRVHIQVGIIAKAGEWVATPQQMAALLSGRSGGGQGGIVIQVHAGTVVGSNGMHELAEVMHVELRKRQRRGGDLGFS